MSLRRATLTVCITLFPAFASAQTVARDPNSTFVSLSQSTLTTTQFYNDSGIPQPNGCTFQKDATTVYAETGFDAKNTGSVQFEYDHLTCSGPATDGLNDIQLAWLHELVHAGTTHFSWKAQAFVPTGYSIMANPRIGYGRIGGQFGFAYAGNMKALGGYGFYSIEAGVRGYFSYPAPQLRVFGTAGADLSKNVQLIGEVELNQAIGAGQTLTNVGLNPTIFPRYSDGQVFGILRVRFAPHLSLVVSTSGVFYGRDYGIGATNEIGLWGDF